MVCYPEEELLRIQFASLVHPDDRDANLEQNHRLRAGEISPFRIENRYVRKGGETIWVQKFVSALTDAAGTPAQLIALVTDITDRKADEHRQDGLLQRERLIAETLQRSIIPPQLPQLMHGYRLAAVYRPALREAEVGGDFYDVFEIDESRIGLLIGDVAGKGLQAAIRVAAARHTVRAYAYMDPRPARVLEMSNKVLCQDPGAQGGGMLTAFFAVIDVAGDVIYYAGAGHEPPVVAGPAGAVDELGGGGVPLGIVREASYSQGTRKMSPRDTIVLVTDGITEARNAARSLFGRRGLIEHILRNQGAEPAELASGLLEAAKLHAGGDLQDDAAVVVLSVRQGAA